MLSAGGCILDQAKLIPFPRMGSLETEPLYKSGLIEVYAKLWEGICRQGGHAVEIWPVQVHKSQERVSRAQTRG